MKEDHLESPAIEIIKGTSYLSILTYMKIDKLYWMSGNKPPLSSSDAYFFNIDLVS